MKIKLYTWTELHEMHNEYAHESNVYGIPKCVYQRLTKHSHTVIPYDSDDVFRIKSNDVFRIKSNYFIPHSCVKEVIK